VILSTVVVLIGLLKHFLMGEQRDGNAPTARGQNEAPIWNFLPVLNVMLPRLHLLLGLSNDLLSHFRDWLEERVEPLTPEETEARNMTLLAEIATEELEEQLKQMKDALSRVIEKRKDLNKKCIREVWEGRKVLRFNLKKIWYSLMNRRPEYSATILRQF
jgi:hypothetical protein